jgi:hypothetical protein
VEDDARVTPELPRPDIRGTPRTMSDILFSCEISELVILLNAPGNGGKELASMVKLSAAVGA